MDICYKKKKQIEYNLIKCVKPCMSINGITFGINQIQDACHSQTTLKININVYNSVRFTDNLKFGVIIAENDKHILSDDRSLFKVLPLTIRSQFCLLANYLVNCRMNFVKTFIKKSLQLT